MCRVLAYATAIAQAFAQAEACKSCTAAVDAFAYATEEVMVSVVAEAEIEVHAVRGYLLHVSTLPVICPPVW